MINGVGISSGIEIGTAHIISTYVLDIQFESIEPDSVGESIDRVHAAILQSEAQLNKIISKIGEDEKEQIEILSAHIEIIKDPTLEEKILNHIGNDLMASERAVSAAIEEFAAVLDCLYDDYFKCRAADIRDVGIRIIKNLIGISLDLEEEIADEQIIVSNDLTPSELVSLDRNKIKAIISGTGGKTCHIAIIARGMGIPAVAGIGNCCDQIQEGDTLIVNGETGEIFINPDKKTADEYISRKKKQKEEKEALEIYKNLPAITKDGKRVEICANLAFYEEHEAVFANGGEGVGLFRTEFLYMDKEDWPDEEYQYEQYKRILEAMKGLPVIFRTTDIGGDKKLKYLQIPHEDNPFLGLRAIRLCLAKQEVFITQLKALLRAAVYGKMRIMIPMITTVSEVREAKKLLEKAKEILKKEGEKFEPNVEMGIMVEVPAAAIIAEKLAQEVDFFSIGTNDLIQYTLAADRMNKSVAYLYDGYHPAVLTLIKQVIDASHKFGKWTGMCGEMAGSEAAVLFLGMGLDEFSVAPSKIPKFKETMSRISYSQAKEVTEKVLTLGTSDEIREVLNRSINNG